MRSSGTDLPPFVVRAALPHDAPALAGLIDDLNRFVGAGTGAMSAQKLVRDGMGPQKRFSLLVAEMQDRLVGYAAWHEAYETEHGGAGIFLIDLFVVADMRRRGVARALMAGVAAAGSDIGAVFMSWTSIPSNAGAHAAYHALGAVAEPMIVHHLSGPSLSALADQGAAHRAPRHKEKG